MSGRSQILSSDSPDLDGSFRNEMEKIRNNELGSLTGQLSEMERGQNKKLTSSISTLLEASEGQIRQAFEQHIKREIKSENQRRKAFFHSILEASVGEIPQEFDQIIQEENNRLTWKFLRPKRKLMNRKRNSTIVSGICTTSWKIGMRSSWDLQRMPARNPQT